MDEDDRTRVDVRVTHLMRAKTFEVAEGDAGEALYFGGRLEGFGFWPLEGLLGHLC